MVRLHQGWGWDWLKTHKVQLLVVVLANPLLVWAIGRFHVLELSTLPPMLEFLKTAKMMKLLKFSKILNFLHLGEVMTKVHVVLSHVTWLVNADWLAAGFLALGIVSAALEGGAVTPLYALDVWFDVGYSMSSSLTQFLLSTIPLFIGAILASMFRHRRKEAMV